MNELRPCQYPFRFLPLVMVMRSCHVFDHELVSAAISIFPLFVSSIISSILLRFLLIVLVCQTTHLLRKIFLL